MTPQFKAIMVTSSVPFTAGDRARDAVVITSGVEVLTMNREISVRKNAAET
jgi:hypothetical protein